MREPAHEFVKTVGDIGQDTARDETTVQESRWETLI